MLSLLDCFDRVFSDSFKCFLPPPYNTAKDMVKALERACKRSESSKFIIRHNRRKATKK